MLTDFSFLGKVYETILVNKNLHNAKCSRTSFFYCRENF
jgi:hypothetical protein